MSKPVKKDIKFMNTRLLLKKYREIQLSVNCRQIEIKDNALYFGIRKNDVMRSFKQTADNEIAAQRIANVNYSLINYMAICLDKMRQSNDKGKQYYEYIYITYLTMDTYTPEEMYAHFGVKRTRFYTHLDKAIERLSVIMWGIGAMETDEFKELCKMFYSFAPYALNKRNLLSLIINSINDVDCDNIDKNSFINSKIVEDPAERENIREIIDNVISNTTNNDVEKENINKNSVVLNSRDIEKVQKAVQIKIAETEEVLKDLKKIQKTLFDLQNIS